MPGPNSAPNGNAQLVDNPKLRLKLAKRNKLVTGKTATKKTSK